MKPFLDTNIIVHSQVQGEKTEAAKALLQTGGVISVQVLNECVDVLRRKARLEWSVVERVSDDLRDYLGPPLPITLATHTQGIHLARDHGFALYDAMIIASALQAGCTTLLSEDMQHGRRLGPLTIHNPFL